jgi:hypothetical protein
MWFYVQRVLIPHQLAEAEARGIPRGILSDLYPRWYGTRELWLHHRDPYGPEVTAEIQSGYYGRLLDPLRADDPRDQQRFAYPIYVAFLLAPTVRWAFENVQMLAFWLLGLFTAAGALLWLRVLHWKMTVAGRVMVLALVMGLFPVVQGLKLQQLTLLVSALIAAAAAAVGAGQLVLAGCLLALATIKPQLVLLLAAWLMVWVMGEWRARQRFFWGLLGAMSLLLIGAEWLLPKWLPEFYAGTVAYREYAGGASLLVALLGHLAGTILNVTAVSLLAVTCWQSRREPAGSPRWSFVTALVLAVTVVVIPMTATYNQLLLLPAILLAARWWNRQLSGRRLIRLAWGLCFLLLAWPWAVTLAMMSAAMVTPAKSLQGLWWLPTYPTVLLPLAVLAPLASMGPRTSCAA